LRGNQYNGRLDYYASPRDQFAVSTYLTALSTTSADGNSQSRPSSDVPLQALNTLVTAIYVHTFSGTLVNSCALTSHVSRRQP
jgi:hypothetical protein